MSFSSRLKSELCKIRTSGCCKIAECYGILLTSRAFSSDAVSILTESEDVAIKYAACVRRVFDMPTKTVSRGNTRELLSVSVAGAADRKKIMNFFHNAAGFDHAVTAKDCCAAAFLRGVFLACGGINDPNNSYRLELVLPRHAYPDEIFSMLAKLSLSPTRTTRAGHAVIYLKESDKIEDLLTLIGAQNYTLELMGIKIYKDMRNKANRISNCETANITKTVNAAVTQLNAIRILKKSGRLDTLPDDLRSAAALRENNPEASLSELCRINGDSITRSSLNRRLSKLVSLSKE